MKNKLFSFLLSPYSMLVGLISGILIGLFQTEWVPYIGPFGHIYLTALQMCIAPILLSAISLNIGRLIQSSLGGVYLKKIVVIMLLILLIISFVGLIAALGFKPGAELGHETLQKLGSVINKSTLAPDLDVLLGKDYALKIAPESGIMKFMNRLVTDNIFKSLSNGMNLQILFFAIVFGVALGNLSKEKSIHFLEIIEAVYLSVTKIVNWLMYLLPFGLAGLLATQFSTVDIGVLFAMTKFVVIMISIYAFVFVIGSFVIAYYTGKKAWDAIMIIEKPILIALGTQSSLACIPSTISAMIRDFNLNKQVSSLLIPLGITMFRFGNVAYFAVASIFVMEIYQVEMTTAYLVIVIFGSIFAGLATAGTSGILTISMLAIVLEPLNLPLDAVLVLFIVIDPILDPFRTLCNVHTNILGTVIIINNDVNDENEFIDNQSLVYES